MPGAVRRTDRGLLVTGIVVALNIVAVDCAYAQYPFVDYTDPKVQKATGQRPTVMGPTCNPPRVPRNAGPDVRAARVRMCLHTNGIAGPPPLPGGWYWRIQSVDIYNCPPGSKPQRYRVLTGEQFTNQPCGKLAWGATKDYADSFGETWPRNVERNVGTPEEKADETKDNTKTETSLVVPSGNALSSPVGYCSYVGQTGCIASPTGFTVVARISADSQAYCTYGTASPGPLLFKPADDLGNPLPPPVNIGNDQPADGQKQGGPRITRGDDKDNGIGATPGPDELTGGKGDDTFIFHVNRFNPNDPDATLDDGDRITDYESGEVITIFGARLDDSMIKIVYDPKKDETHIDLDLPGFNGQADGKTDKTIILNGDKRGKLKLTIACCTAESTDLQIDIPPKDTSPKTAEESNIKSVEKADAKDGRPQQQATEPNGVGSGDNSDKSQNKSESRPKSGGPKAKESSEEKDPVPLNLNLEGKDKHESVLKLAEEHVVPSSVSPPPKTDTIAQTADGTKPEAEITLIFKVTDEVLHGQPSGSELKKTDLVKLVTKDPPLPKTGGSKLVQDKGFASSPVACVTDSNHECRAKLPGADRELYGFPVSDQRIYQTDFAMRRNNGVVIEEDGKTETALPQVTSEVTLTATGFKIGDKTFKRIAINAPESSVPGILEKLREAFGPRLQIDYCGEKKPGPPLGMEPLSYSSLNSELPKAEVRLGP